jgi:hypothetical protein
VAMVLLLRPHLGLPLALSLPLPMLLARARMPTPAASGLPRKLCALTPAAAASCLTPTTAPTISLGTQPLSTMLLLSSSGECYFFALQHALFGRAWLSVLGSTVRQTR